MTAFNGDRRSSRQRPSGRMDTSEVRRLRRDTGRGHADHHHGCWASPEMSNTELKTSKKLCISSNFIQQRSYNTHTYHKGEGLGGDCFVVRVNAVPDTHFYLSLLHPVTRGVIQPTHNPEKGETQRWRDELHRHWYQNARICLLNNETAISDERRSAQWGPSEGKTEGGNSTEQMIVRHFSAALSKSEKKNSFWSLIHKNNTKQTKFSISGNLQC